MAVIQLGAKALGTIVKLKVSGIVREFIVVHQGRPSSIYDGSCDGTWLLMKDIYEKRGWHSAEKNDYANSTIHSYLNSAFLNLFDANIKSAMKQVKIPYRPGSGTSMSVNTGTNGLSCKVFLLSGCEVGFAESYLPPDGAKLAYFEPGNSNTSANNKRIGYLGGNADNWWMRSPRAIGMYGSSLAYFVGSRGSLPGEHYTCISALGIRPALILPPTLSVLDDGSVTTNTAPGIPASISIPSSISGGTTITVSWGTSADAEANLEGYIAERSVNGGSTWSQIYQGSVRSTTNSVAFGTATVMYRVKAYDNDGFQSGYRTSSQVTVINNVAPRAPASINVPLMVEGGKPLTVTWAAATDSDGNLSGYCLERSVGGAAWGEIFRGNALSYTDTITKGWNTVAYRVRAYDAYTIYSSYAVSATRTVNNNTPPSISCNSSSGSDLGQKAADFSVSYIVNDVDGDTVSVTEAIDGVAMRTFSAVRGASNSFTVTGNTFMRLLNGVRTMTITASDGKASSAHTLKFTKLVTAASITLETPMAADAKITVAALSVLGSIPVDASYSVKVTNNAKDSAPAWENCTDAVKRGVNYVFVNQVAAKGFAFNFKVEVRRGSSGIGGFISSIQGGFQ